jgi:hypothetical protein
MKIIKDAICLEELRQMAVSRFGNLVKAVVDIDKICLALDAELHSDLEALLLESGSKQKDLWGINLYPELEGGQFIEFDSMINIRPSQGNKTRGVDDEGTRNKIIALISKMVKK